MTKIIIQTQIGGYRGYSSDKKEFVNFSNSEEAKELNVLTYLPFSHDYVQVADKKYPVQSQIDGYRGYSSDKKEYVNFSNIEEAKELDVLTYQTFSHDYAQIGDKEYPIQSEVEYKGYNFTTGEWMNFASSEEAIEHGILTPMVSASQNFIIIDDIS